MHNKCIDVIHKSFSALNEFMKWKEDFEENSRSSYVLHWAPKCHSDSNYVSYYYYCNRSGKYSSRGKGVRELKIQGSSKMGTHCPAYIRAKKDQDGQIEVELCNYHTHEQQLAHLPLPLSTRETVAAKLADGVTISNIFDSIREEPLDGVLSRKHLLCRQDIHNIRYQYNIEGVQLHSDDHTSVSLLVENMMELTDNPIFIYKKQGQKQSADMNDLSDEDFVIGIQTHFQRDMLIKFGEKAICMDSTHGTNVYDFYLITVLILDEFGEGVPICWIISNREDSALVHQALIKVKEKCGDIHTSIFMSDDAENFYNAWRGVFTTTNTKKLLCAWHIDKSWRKGIQRHVSNKAKHESVYHGLRALLNEGEEASFRFRLQQFISWLFSQEEFSDFLEYFQKEYTKRIEQWAPCYRIATVVNTNMAVESFHHVLKACYMERKQNRRVDKLVHFLLKIARDKVFDRAIKTQKGKLTHRFCEIKKRHKNAEEAIPLANIQSVTKGKTWKVQSSDKNRLYTVDISSACSCKLKCSQCDICVHSFTCTCMDFILHATICKHIHMVCIKLKQIDGSDSTTEIALQLSAEPAELVDTVEEQPEQVSTSESIDNLEKYLQTTASDEASTSRTKALELCKQIETTVLNCTNVSAINNGMKHLHAALMVIRSMNNNPCRDTSFLVRKRPASNANSDVQFRFKSTKRKKESTRQTLSKPNKDEMDTCIENLDEIEVNVCGICLQTNDGCHSSFVDWIECQFCQIWYHQNCVDSEDSDDLIFICPLCKL